MPDPEAPNILLIFTDQHRLSAMGSYGLTPCQTPNLDRLAEGGYRFETAYTTCPVCSPARATVMTGLYPHGHGVTTNIHHIGCSVHELRDRPELLSRRLGRAGYRCGYTGKWHLGSERDEAFGAPNTPSLPREVGFEGQNFPGHGDGGHWYEDYKQYRAEKGYEHGVRQAREGVLKLRRQGILEAPEEATVPHFLADHTMGMMDRFAASGEQFFIWHNFWGPHAPYWVPEELYDLYRDVEIPEWPNYRWEPSETDPPWLVKRHPDAGRAPWEAWAESIRYYYAFTTLIDRQIGRILEHLEETGLRDDTVVLFTADHGETLGTHGGLEDKGWHHFEEIQRIPFIAWLPERYRPEGREPGETVEGLVSLADLYPTVLDLAGAPCEEGELQGRSLLPLLEGREQEWRDGVVVQFHGLGGLLGNLITFRRGELKYCWNGAAEDELYDLSSDPHEMQNRIADPACADVLGELRRELLEWLEEAGYPYSACRQLESRI